MLHLPSPRLPRGVLWTGVPSRLIFGALVFVATFLSSVFVQAVWPRQAAPSELHESEVAPGAVSRTDRQIGVLQEKLRQRPEDRKTQTTLAFQYLQKVRETGDYSYYTRAETLMQGAYEQAPDDPEVLLGLGSLALSRHQWDEALNWGRQVVAANPYKADAYGVVGDAQVGLGRYDEAVATFQKMVDLRPGVGSYARASYVRELYGDLPGAVEAMRMAADTAEGLGEAGVWTRVQLGHLLLQLDRREEAEAEYRRALAVDPNSMLAIAGLGRLKMAAGDYAGAIPEFERAFQGLPLPEFVLALGDLYEATGRPEEAARQFELSRALQQLFAGSGGNADLELALFEAERGDPAKAVELARRELARSQSIHASDVLAWALYQAGDYPAAREASRQALRLGTQDGLMLFHAGMIDARLGDVGGAREKLERSLERSPGGYAARVYAPTARQVLAELGAGG